jgi:hypothetical protein
MPLPRRSQAITPLEWFELIIAFRPCSLFPVGKRWAKRRRTTGMPPWKLHRKIRSNMGTQLIRFCEANFGKPGEQLGSERGGLD